MTTVSDRRSILINAAASWTGFATQLAIVFVTAPLLVHGLGDRRYGMWALVESVLAYLTLLDLGVAASVVRYVARLEAARDREGVNRIVATSVCIFAAAGAVVLMASAGIAAVGLPLLGVPDDLFAETAWMLLLLGLNLGVGLPLQTYSAVLDGLGRYPVKTALRTAAAVLRVPLIVGVVLAGGGLVALSVVIFVANVAEHIALAVAARRCFPELRFSLAAANWQTFHTIRGYSADAFVALVAGRISYQTDSLVIASCLAPQFITFFAVGARLVESVKSLLRAGTTVLTPAVSALEARGDDHGVRRILFDSTRWVLWLILPIQAGVLLLGRPFLTLWMGPRHAEECFPTLAILAIPLGLAVSQSVAARILYGVGRLRWFSRAVLAEAAANLLLSLILVRFLGIEGVAWATTIPQVVFNFVLIGHICRQLQVRVHDYLRQSFAGPVMATCLPAAVWIGVACLDPPANWVSFFCTGLVGMLVYIIPAAGTEFGFGTLWSRCRELSWRRRSPSGEEPTTAAGPVAAEPRLSPTP